MKEREIQTAIAENLSEIEKNKFAEFITSILRTQSKNQIKILLSIDIVHHHPIAWYLLEWPKNKDNSINLQKRINAIYELLASKHFMMIIENLNLTIDGENILAWLLKQAETDEKKANAIYYFYHHTNIEYTNAAICHLQINSIAADEWYDIIGYTLINHSSDSDHSSEDDKNNLSSNEFNFPVVELSTEHAEETVDEVSEAEREKILKESRLFLSSRQIACCMSYEEGEKTLAMLKNHLAALTTGALKLYIDTIMVIINRDYGWRNIECIIQHLANFAAFNFTANNLIKLFDHPNAWKNAPLIFDYLAVLSRLKFNFQQIITLIHTENAHENIIFIIKAIKKIGPIKHGTHTTVIDVLSMECGGKEELLAHQNRYFDMPRRFFNETPCIPESPPETPKSGIGHNINK